MSTIVLCVFGAFFAIAAILVAFVWAICRAAGMPPVDGRGAIIAAGVLLILAILSIGSAFAHDPYSGWTQPGTGKSCCNQMSPDRSSGDCRPVRSYKGDDGRHYVFLSGRWQPVPAERVLQIPSPDGNSHACANVETDEIHCFVPGQPKG